MKTLSRILIVVGTGAVVGGLAEWCGPRLLASLPVGSRTRQAIELPLGAAERLAQFVGKMLDPEYRTLAPSDSSTSYDLYLLVFFALLGGALGLVAYLAVSLMLKCRSGGTPTAELQ